MISDLANMFLFKYVYNYRQSENLIIVTVALTYMLQPATIAALVVMLFSKAN